MSPCGSSGHGRHSRHGRRRLGLVTRIFDHLSLKLVGLKKEACFLVGVVLFTDMILEIFSQKIGGKCLF
jgi:hypothetical protein